jgi:hypothetical protein
MHKDPRGLRKIKCGSDSWEAVPGTFLADLQEELRAMQARATADFPELDAAAKKEPKMTTLGLAVTCLENKVLMALRHEVSEIIY